MALLLRWLLKSTVIGCPQCFNAFPIASIPIGRMVPTFRKAVARDQPL